MKVLVGCDPEFLCAAVCGTHKSVIGLIPGTKENPSPIIDGTIQVDGIAVELGIIPASTSDIFDQRVAHVLSQAQNMLQDYGLNITHKASAFFDATELTHPQAQVFGCDPDFNAWQDGMENMSPSANGNMRVAGGHIHVGCDDIDVIQLVKTLDLTIAVPSLHLEDPLRKMMYGKAGCFRQKPYGVEYRTPSNFWTFTAERRKWIFDQVCRAVSIHRTLEIPQQVQEVIDSFDLDTARMISSDYGMELCQ